MAAVFLDLARVKAQLNITGTDDDAELAPLIDAARDVVEAHTGQIVERRSFSEELVLDRSTTRVRLSNVPVVELTSATGVDGSPVDVTGAMPRPSGLVYLTKPVSGFLGVVYTAGLDTVPENYVTAGAIIVEHLWNTQRGAMPPALAGLEDSLAYTGATAVHYAIPNRALELLGARRPVVA